MQLLLENSSALRNSKCITPDVLKQLISDTQKINSPHFQASLLQNFNPVIKARPLVNSADLCIGTSRSALWLPLDMLLEDATDGSQVNATSAIEIITGKEVHLFLALINSSIPEDNKKYKLLWPKRLEFLVSFLQV